VLLIFVALVFAVGVFMTPWRALTLIERLWAVLMLADVVGIFSLPVEPATSPWRSVIHRAYGIGVAICVVLMGAGAVLVSLRRASGRPARPLLPVFGIGSVLLLLLGLTSLVWFVGSRQ
jgi:hypothetical protein